MSEADGHSEVMVAQFGLRLELPAGRWSEGEITVIVGLRLCGEDGIYEGRTMINDGAWSKWEPVDLALGASQEATS